jgi:hypothetical protein
MHGDLGLNYKMIQVNSQQFACIPQKMYILTATAESDYYGEFWYDLGFTYSPEPGDIECVNISIVDDTEQEMTEVFNAMVVLVYWSCYLCPPVPITITDNDG